MYLYFTRNVKLGINQHTRNDMCHAQSLEKDFYFGTPSSFYHVFTLLHILLTMYNILTLTSIKVEITSHVLPTLGVFGSQASTWGFS
jgi:hypothetical protein